MIGQRSQGLMIYKNKMTGRFDRLHTRNPILDYYDEYSMKSRVENFEMERTRVQILPARRVCVIVHASQRNLMPFHQHLQYFDEL